LAERTAPQVALACLAAGLVVNGITPTALRIAPPLTVSSAELVEGTEILGEVLAAGAAGEMA
jgi:4-aminobutyrate aminotransferase-like enzyme